MFLTPEDLAPFADIDLAKALAMIEDAEAMAFMAAPCLAVVDLAGASVLTDQQRLSARAILRSAVLRWDQQGAGALVQETIGPYSTTYDNRERRRGLLWPSEIEALQKVCAAATARKVFTISTAPEGSIHLPWCSLNFGALYCSCGADIAGYPIYEGGLL